MTKYAFFTLQLLLFCFLAFDFSSEAVASETETCLSQCKGGNTACINACRGFTAPAVSGRSQATSANQKQRPASDQSCNITCKAPQEPQRVGGECGCYTPSDDESLTRSMYNNNPGTGASDSSLNNAVNSCKAVRDAAFVGCDQDQDSGMQGAQSDLLSFASQAGAMGMGACTKLAPILAGANAATVYFNKNCGDTRSDCMKTCKASADNLRQMAGPGIDSGYLAQQQGVVDGYYDECKKLDAKVAQSQQAIQGMVQAIPGVASCATGGNTDFSSYCTANPTALGCATVATDCSNPQMAASNQICICKNNPNAAGCGPQVKVSDMGPAGGAEMSSLTGNGGPGSSISDSPFSTLGWDGNGMAPSSGKADEIGGKMGRGANLGDSGGGAPGGGDGRGGGASQAAQVNAGFRGGGGGWGNGGNGGRGDGDGRPYDPRNPQAAAGGPDLKQFLPGGKLDPKLVNRGLAGITGPDGITGPHSDIWKKIQNRYWLKNSELMP